MFNLAQDLLERRLSAGDGDRLALDADGRP